MTVLVSLLFIAMIPILPIKLQIFTYTCNLTIQITSSYNIVLLKGMYDSHFPHCGQWNLLPYNQQKRSRYLKLTTGIYLKSNTWNCLDNTTVRIADEKSLRQNPKKCDWPSAIPIHPNKANGNQEGNSTQNEPEITLWILSTKVGICLFIITHHFIMYGKCLPLHKNIKET